MKAYVVTSGAIFALLTAAHVWRIMAEDPRLGADPLFLGITLCAGALSVWAFLTLQRLKR